MGGSRARHRTSDGGVHFRVRSRTMRIHQGALMAIGLLVAGAGCTQGQSSAGVSVPYTVLDDQASQLRADFNGRIGSVRLLFVVDPICPGCLRGLADMNRDLLRGTADPRLRTFVVHEPVLGVARYAPWLRPSGGKDVPKAARLVQNSNVQHYWNPSGAFGHLLSQAVELKNGEKQVYAWGEMGWHRTTSSAPPHASAGRPAWQHGVPSPGAYPSCYCLSARYGTSSSCGRHFSRSWAWRACSTPGAAVGSTATSPDRSSYCSPALGSCMASACCR